MIGKFDVVVSSAIYTQLFEARAYEIYKQYRDNYSPKEQEEIFQSIQKISSMLVELFNATQCSLAKDEGIIVTWSDIAHLHELSPSEAAGHPFKIPAEKLFTAGVCGLKTLSYMITGFLVKWWEWPFNFGRIYKTVAIAGIKSRQQP